MKSLKKNTEFQKNTREKTMDVISDQLLDLDNSIKNRNEQVPGFTKTRILNGNQSDIGHSCF